METFGAVATSLHLLVRTVKKVREAYEAEDTLDQLIKCLTYSSSLIEVAKNVFDSLPSDVRQRLPLGLDGFIQDTGQEYSDLLNTLAGYFDETKAANPVRRVAKRSWNGLKFVINKSTLEGRIEELREQDKKIQDTTKILDAITNRDNNAAIGLLNKTLAKLEESLDATKFFDVVSQLSTKSGRSPREILNNMSASPPKWILGEASFQAWRNNNSEHASPWLWIRGKAGVGKSHLATFIAQHIILDSDQLRDSAFEVQEYAVASRSESVAVVIYYCTIENKDNCKIESIIRSMLGQLLYRLWDVAPTKAWEFVPQVQKLIGSDDMLVESESTRDIVRALIQAFDWAYIVVDGLDELVQSTRGEVIESLKYMHSPRVKYVMTSRNGLDHYAKDPRLRAELIDATKNEETIRLYIDNRLHRIAARHASENLIGNCALPNKLATQDNITELRDRIVAAASGSFLCAQLMINQLKIEGPDDVDRAMESLTSNIEEIVHGIQKRIRAQSERDKSGTFIGENAMTWMMYTRGRSLKLAELQQALTLSAGLKSARQGMYSKEKIAEATCYFISFESGSDSITIHQAVKEYCVSPKEWDDGDGRKAHGLLAKVGLACLSEYQSPCTDLADWEKAIEKSPLLSYAAVNWGWHMEQAEECLPENPFRLLKLQRLIGQDKFLDIVTVALQPKLDELGIWESCMWEKLKEKTPPVSTLHLLAYFNLKETADEWLGNGKCVHGFEKPTDDQVDCSPLFVAVSLNHHEFAEILLAHGADPNRPEGSFKITSFLAAIRTNNETLVDLFLNNASQEEAERMASRRAWRNVYPLFLAVGSVSRPGCPAIVDRILREMESLPNKEEILLHKAGPLKQTILHRAAECNDVESIDLILNFTEDAERLLEARNKNGGTPLIRAAWASHRGSTGAIKSLLEWGSNPNLQANGGLTAAHLAIMNEPVDKVDGFAHLLPVTDLSITGSYDQTVFHLACRFGKPNHLSLLLTYLEKYPSILQWTNLAGLTPIALAAAWVAVEDDDETEVVRHRIRCIELLIPVMGEDLSEEDIEVLFELDGPGRITELLLDHCSAAKALIEKSLSRRFLDSVTFGYDQGVKTMMKRYGTFGLSEPEPEGSQWHNLVVIALRLGNGSVVKVMLEQGAKIPWNAKSAKARRKMVEELCHMGAVEAIWAHQPEILRFIAQMEEETHGAASYRNPVRVLARANDLEVTPENGPEEIQCLTHETTDEGNAVVVGCKDFGRLMMRDRGPEDNINELGEMNEVYTESPPISKSTKIPLSKIHVSITGRDQGWSSHTVKNPQDKGTYKGSSTGYQLGLKRDGEIIHRAMLTRNLLNTDDWTTYHMIWDSDEGRMCDKARVAGCVWVAAKDTMEPKEFVRLVRSGDQLCIIAIAQGSEWECWIKHASIRAFYEDYWVED